MCAFTLRRGALSRGLAGLVVRTFVNQRRRSLVLHHESSHSRTIVKGNVTGLGSVVSQGRGRRGHFRNVDGMIRWVPGPLDTIEANCEDMSPLGWRSRESEKQSPKRSVFRIICGMLGAGIPHAMRTDMERASSECISRFTARFRIL